MYPEHVIQRLGFWDIVERSVPCLLQMPLTCRRLRRADEKLLGDAMLVISFDSMEHLKTRGSEVYSLLHMCEHGPHKPSTSFRLDMRSTLEGVSPIDR